MGHLFITGDLHLGHYNIIKYANRPFSDINEMNKQIIHRWNMRVKTTDTVIHNGDFCFVSNRNKGNGMPIKAEEWRNKLNGNIIFIKGNHDNNNSIKSHIINMLIRYGGHDIFITHRPQDMNTNYSINFVAHSHDSFTHRMVYDGEKRILLINVGVDVWDFYPRTINEVLNEYRKFI